MLLLSTPKSITVDGVTVFPDHADPNQFWYLPGPVSLAKRPDGQAVFTFIKYKPAAVEGGAKGGGFVMFTSSLHLDPKTESKIKGQLSGIAPGDPILSAVQFDTGTVKCIALNLQGSGGTSASAAQPGSFNAVEQIQGASTPSLQGDEEAAFSLTLSQEGATILEQAYKQGTGPIGVIYDLKFTGLRPALDVKITADFKRIYDGLSASLSGQYYFVKADLEAAFEKMKQDGSIKIEVFNFTNDQDAKDKEKWALDFFKQDLLAKWFEPTLSLGKPNVDTGGDGGGLPGAVGTALGKAVGGGNQGGSPPATPKDKPATPKADSPAADKNPTADKKPDAAKPSADAAKSPSPAKTDANVSAPPPVAPKVAPAPKPPAAPVAHAPAALTQTPNPPPAGYGMQFKPATSGLTETITVVVDNGTPTVTVDGKAKTLSGNQFTVDVAPGESHDIKLDYPAGKQPTETFDLLFQYDLPAAAGFSIQPPSASYKAYLTNTANDQPFRQSHAPSGSSASKGAQALRDWIDGLADPKTVELDAHASWEGSEATSTVQHNLDLSNRRLQVALGIIGNHATAKVSTFTGDQEAHNAGRKSAPGGTAANPDRVVHVKGNTGSAAAQTTITGKISRAADPVQPDQPKPDQPKPDQPKPDQPKPDQPKPDQPKPDQPKPDQPKKDEPQKGGGDDQIAGAPAVALKLKFVHQDEQKTMVFEYHRSDATQRSYAPQGFFGLMLADLKDDEKHFVEVDLDDPFFRQFAVTVQSPIDYQKIGLLSSHVSLDYGDPGDADNFKHGDAIFDPSRPKEFKFAVFMNANHDTNYTYASEYHFDPNAAWDGRAFSYQFPPKKTEDRTLFLNPYDQIGFLEVQVFPHQVDPGVMDSIDVALSHTDPGGQVVQRTLSVTPGSQPQFWRVRMDDPQARSYTYQLTHHLKDGTVKHGDPVTTTATALPVNDPFERAIEIDFVPMLNPANTRMVFIDVQYDDDKNSYNRRERLVLQGNAQNPVHLRIALLNPALTTYRYRLTFVGSGNQMKQGNFIETTETLIAVSDAP